MSTEKRDALINQMLDDEVVQVMPTLSGRGKVLVHARFLRANGEPVSARDDREGSRESRFSRLRPA